MEIHLPPELEAEVDDLVGSGEFPDNHAAIVALVRVGLSYRYRRSPSPGMPREPRELPSRPGLPDDVNWIR